MAPMDNRLLTEGELWALTHDVPIMIALRSTEPGDTRTSSQIPGPDGTVIEIQAAPMDILAIDCHACGRAVMTMQWPTEVPLVLDEIAPAILGHMVMAHDVALAGIRRYTSGG